MPPETLYALNDPMCSPQICPKCSSNGPFYPSQNRKGAWCIACFQAINRARARAVRAHRIEGAPEPRLAMIRAKPPEARTRREQLVLLRAACPPGREVCAWCWGEQPLKHFHLNKMNRNGLNHYCRTCRQILERLAQYYSKQGEVGCPS